MRGKCAICGKPNYIGFNYLCKKHWLEYNTRMNEDWLVMLINSEIKERNLERRERDFISIETLIDIEDKG